MIGRQSPMIEKDRSTSKHKIHKEVHRRESKWPHAEVSQNLKSVTKSNQTSKHEDSIYSAGDTKTAAGVDTMKGFKANESVDELYDPSELSKHANTTR